MTESKIDLTDRLKREGRWEEASLFKDEKIKELRTTGLKRPEAQDKAWEAMEMQFPPIEIPQEDELDWEFTPEEIAHLSPGSLENFPEDVSWVYSHLELRDADIGSAPSAGAVGLLGWARANRADFFSKILPRAIQLQEKQSDQDAMAEQEHLRIDRLFRQVQGGDLLEDIMKESDAVKELKAAKGFAKHDYSGFAAYLEGLIEG